LGFASKTEAELRQSTADAVVVTVDVGKLKSAGAKCRKDVPRRTY
jgi:hypothetical protein